MCVSGQSECDSPKRRLLGFKMRIMEQLCLDDIRVTAGAVSPLLAARYAGVQTGAAIYSIRSDLFIGEFMKFVQSFSKAVA